LEGAFFRTGKIGGRGFFPHWQNDEGAFFRSGKTTKGLFSALAN